MNGLDCLTEDSILKIQCEYEYWPRDCLRSFYTSKTSLFMFDEVFQLEEANTNLYMMRFNSGVQPPQVRLKCRTANSLERSVKVRYNSRGYSSRNVLIL